MMTTLLFLAAIQTEPAPAQQQVQAPAAQAQAPAPATAESGVEVQKNIIYQKETNVDLTGSVVEAENQMPPAFFLSKMSTPKAHGLLEERLKFSLRNYNDMGF